MYTESDLDALILQSINDCKNLPYICQFKQTEIGKNRIAERVKQHILVRGVENLDTALGLVETELSEPSNY